MHSNGLLLRILFVCTSEVSYLESKVELHINYRMIRIWKRFVVHIGIFNFEEQVFVEMIVRSDFVDCFLLFIFLTWLIHVVASFDMKFLFHNWGYNDGINSL